MIRVYTASKLSAAPMWRALQETWGARVIFHARWLRHVMFGTADTAENATSFWVEDQEDVQSADVLVVWCEPGQHLRGALVEVGIAIASMIPVIVIGEHADYGTWQHHPGVTRAVDFDDALQLLEEIK